MRPFLVALLLGSLGCRHAADVATTTGAEEEVADAPPMRLVAARPSEFVTEVRGGCESGPDSCTSRGDCVALPVICLENDRLRITARWASSDDVDLYVTDSRGDTVSFLRPNTPAGGRFEQATGRTCLPGREGGTESIAFEGPDVAEGTYRIGLHHFGSCMSGHGSVDVDVTVSAGGRQLATYRASLVPSDRVTMLEIDVAP